MPHFRIQNASHAAYFSTKSAAEFARDADDRLLRGRVYRVDARPEGFDLATIYERDAHDEGRAVALGPSATTRQVSAYENVPVGRETGRLLILEDAPQTRDGKRWRRVFIELPDGSTVDVRAVHRRGYPDRFTVEHDTSRSAR